MLGRYLAYYLEEMMDNLKVMMMGYHLVLMKASWKDRDLDLLTASNLDLMMVLERDLCLVQRKATYLVSVTASNSECQKDVDLEWRMDQARGQNLVSQMAACLG